MTTLRTNLMTALQLRLSSLGHVLVNGELAMLCDDIEAQIALDAQAQADANTDLGNNPDPPIVPGQ